MLNYGDGDIPCNIFKSKYRDLITGIVGIFSMIETTNQVKSNQ